MRTHHGRYCWRGTDGELTIVPAPRRDGYIRMCANCNITSSHGESRARAYPNGSDKVHTHAGVRAIAQGYADDEPCAPECTANGHPHVEIHPCVPAHGHRGFGDDGIDEGGDGDHVELRGQGVWMVVIGGYEGMKMLV